MAADTPIAFFSYCRADSEFALRLARDLKTAGAQVWLDQLDIKPGQRWDRTIEEALGNCPRMLVILSPASVESSNVMDEVSFALEEQKTVIPVLYRECKIPFRLRRLQYADFREEYDLGLKDLLSTLAPPRRPRDTTDAALQVSDRSTRSGSKSSGGPQSKTSCKPPTEEAVEVSSRGKQAPPSQFLKAQEHFQRGRKASQQGEVETGISELQEAVRLAPDYVEARIMLGFSLVAKEAYDAAFQEFQEAVQLQPDSPTAHLGYGILLGIRGHEAEGRREIRRAFELDPDNPHIRNGYEQFVAGEQQGESEKPDEAGLEIRNRPEKRKTKESDDEEALSHLKLAVAAQERNDAETAIAELHQAIRLKKDFPEAHYLLGMQLMAHADTEGATAAFQETLRLAPEHPEGHLGFAIALKMEGKEEESMKELRRAYELDPENAGVCQFYEAIAMDFIEKGKLDLAVAEFRRIIQVNPNSAHGHLGLGVALMKQKDLPAATKEIRVAYQLDPNDEVVKSAV